MSKFDDYITALDRQMASVSGLSPYLLGGEPDDEFSFRRRQTTSGYALSIAMNSAIARLDGPTYRTYRLKIRGRTLVEVRREIESPRERIDRLYAAYVNSTLGLMSKREAESLWVARHRPTRRQRAFMAYVTAYVWLTYVPFWRWLLRTIALALWIAVVALLLVIAWSALPTY